MEMRKTSVSSTTLGSVPLRVSTMEGGTPTQRHISHQYEIMKTPNVEFDWLVQHKRGYSKQPRGDMVEKFDINWVTEYESGKYDVALLHLDQQCLSDDLWERGKGSLFRDVNKAVDCPKILIMHGTPYFPNGFECDITKENYEELGYTEEQIGMSSELIDRYNKIAEQFDYVIFNSKTAAKQWGLHENDNIEGEAVWHGMDPEEWPDNPKEPRVVTMISPAGLPKYYDRTFLRAVRSKLEENNIYHCHITKDVTFNTFEDYRDFLGRSLIYFNPTRESPMPRSRSEAMHCGSCVVTTPHQDADEFIENGENGLIVPRNPESASQLIMGLLEDYEKAVEIGQKGKETAQDLFHADRFRDKWREILEKVSNK